MFLIAIYRRRHLAFWKNRVWLSKRPTAGCVEYMRYQNDCIRIASFDYECRLPPIIWPTCHSMRYQHVHMRTTNVITNVFLSEPMSNVIFLIWVNNNHAHAWFIVEKQSEQRRCMNSIPYGVSINTLVRMLPVRTIAKTICTNVFHTCVCCLFCLPFMAKKNT